MLTNWRRILRTPQVGTLYSLSFLNWLGRNLLTPILPLFIATLPLASVGRQHHHRSDRRDCGGDRDGQRGLSSDGSATVSGTGPS